MTEEALTRCRIIDSSGCHRYDYWNEQSLFDGRPETGWCSPSRSRPSVEHLVVETNDLRPITALTMLSRNINEGGGFPRAVEVLTSATSYPQCGGQWRVVHVASGLTPGAGEWVRIELPLIVMPLMLLRFSGAGVREDGRQFTQFMCLQIVVRRVQ